ncbi:MAG: hypothetical protein PHP46_06055 [Candidatus Omnitrophica bacterium]|nr:hypothetical protein [Candidatus Omnitrophota bacterium]
MMKYKYLMILMCLMLLAAPSMAKSEADEYIKNIEMVDSKIEMDLGHFPKTAYLYIKLKNNGDRGVSNARLEVSYYGDGDYLIKKVIIKKALNEPLPEGGERGYRIPLRGDVFNVRNEQYPYSYQEGVSEFDVKILNVSLSARKR